MPPLHKHGKRSGKPSGSDAATAGACAAPAAALSEEAAAAWHACAGAMAVILRFEERGTVAGVISFWRATSDALLGAWLDAAQPSAGVAMQAPHATRHAALHARMQRYTEWLWRAGPQLLAAAVSAAYAFYTHTGEHRSRRQHASMRPAVSARLLHHA